MIEEIIDYTLITPNKNSIFDLNKSFSMLDQINEELPSFLKNHFEIISEDIKIMKGFEILNQIITKIILFPDVVELCYLDNKGILKKLDKTLYIFKNNKFEEIKMYEKITREKLFIKEDIHDADGIVFFLWDYSKLPKAILDDGRFYREILMLSGFLGQIISEYGELANWKGSLFSEIIEADWRTIISEEYDFKKNIFAYAFQKKKKFEGCEYFV